jgi:hypothetical protein
MTNAIAHFESALVAQLGTNALDHLAAHIANRLGNFLGRDAHL